MTPKQKSVVAGGGVLSVGTIAFLLNTFPLRSELEDTRKALAETRQELKETMAALNKVENRLITVDTIVMQRQNLIARQYE